MTDQLKQQLYAYLANFATTNKREKIEQVVAYRTRYLTVVLEDIYQAQNASAVIRSCDCFGVQDLHVIENRNQFAIKVGVTQGASKWVDIHRYNQQDTSNTQLCLQTLKRQGYRIIATSPHRNDSPLADLSLDGKMALVFGAEELGLSQEALALADEFVHIPMFGFTESFNISVSVAICLYHITTALHQSEMPWQLTPEEALNVKLSWIKKVVNRADLLEKKFLRESGIA